MRDKSSKVTNGIASQFSIIDHGGWYTVVKRGHIGEDLVVGAFVSDDEGWNLMRAKKCLERMRSGYKHPNAKRGDSDE
jgi:hypothetical protein